MWLLLAGIFVLLPLTALAETPSKLSAGEIAYLSAIDPFSPENLSASEKRINEPGPYRNPYSPTAVTNFEALAPQLPQEQAGKGQSRLDAPLYQTHPKRHPQSLDPANPSSQSGRSPRR
jgi:hypothetical protein